MPFLQNCCFVFVEKSRDQMLNCLCQKTCERNRLADLFVRILFTSATHEKQNTLKTGRRDRIDRHYDAVGNVVQRVADNPTRTMAQSLKDLERKFKNQES
jgi:hypothetical protein